MVVVVVEMMVMMITKTTTTLTMTMTIMSFTGSLLSISDFIQDRFLGLALLS